MMNIGWIVPGMVLLGVMAFCAISLYIKRRKEQNESINKSDDLKISAIWNEYPRLDILHSHHKHKKQ